MLARLQIGQPGNHLAFLSNRASRRKRHERQVVAQEPIPRWEPIAACARRCSASLFRPVLINDDICHGEIIRLRPDAIESARYHEALPRAEHFAAVLPIREMQGAAQNETDAIRRAAAQFDAAGIAFPDAACAKPAARSTR